MQEVEDGRTPQSRRLFLVGMGAFLVTIVSIGAGILRFLVPNVEYGKPKRFKVGMPSDFPDKTATYVADQKIFIVRDGNSFAALSAVCTHLGCTVRNNPAGAGFSCPCHGSVYQADGTNIAGPAPKPLDAFEVSSGPNGELIVDKRTTVAKTERFTI
jgi:cytochrome b6-f complex iron-sulfur subunit